MKKNVPEQFCKNIHSRFRCKIMQLIFKKAAFGIKIKLIYSKIRFTNTLKIHLRIN